MGLKTLMAAESRLRPTCGVIVLDASQTPVRKLLGIVHSMKEGLAPESAQEIPATMPTICFGVSILLCQDTGAVMGIAGRAASITLGSALGPALTRRHFSLNGTSTRYCPGVGTHVQHCLVDLVVVLLARLLLVMASACLLPRRVTGVAIG